MTLNSLQRDRLRCAEQLIPRVAVSLPLLAVPVGPTDRGDGRSVDVELLSAECHRAFSLSIPIPIATPTPTPIALRQRMGSVVEVGNEPLPRGEDRRRRAGQRLLRGPRGARDQGPAGRDRGGRRLAMGLATVQYLPAMASRERIAETMRRRAMSGRRMRPGRRACPSPARATRRAVGPHLRRAAYPAAPVDQHGAHVPPRRLPGRAHPAGRHAHRGPKPRGRAHDQRRGDSE